MADIYDQVTQFRAQLLRRERKAAAEMARAYGKVFTRLRKQLNALEKQIVKAQARGEEVNQFWLIRQDRYQKLLQQTASELGQFAQAAERNITKQQQEAVNQALRDSSALVQAAAREAAISVSFTRLPKTAVENLVGALSDGSPLRELLSRLPGNGRQAVADALLEGIALGQNPRAIARTFKSAVGGQLDRALRISRTEVARSYREATRQNYQHNSSVLAGWVWTASISPRACASCLAMNGTFHELTERLDDHPNGRCVMLPALREAPPPVLPNADQWLREQSAATQANVLGSQAAQAAYARGEVELSDFVGRKFDARWGTTRYRKSLREITG